MALGRSGRRAQYALSLSLLSSKLVLPSIFCCRRPFLRFHEPRPKPAARTTNTTRLMIEVVLNDRLGKKVRVKCNEDDTIGDLKKLVAAQVSKATHCPAIYFPVS